VGDTEVARDGIVAAYPEVRRAVMVGSGDSLYLAHLAVEAFEQLGGLPAQAIEAYDFVISRASKVSPSTLCIGISASGTSKLAVRAVQKAVVNGAATVALSNTPDSPLVLAADAALITTAGRSHTFPTKTTTAALATLIALAADFGRASGHLGREAHRAVVAELEGAVPGAVEVMLGDGSRVAALADHLEHAATLAFVGSGMSRAPALIGASKIMETTGRHTIAVNAEEYLHLWGLSMNERDGVVVLFNGAEENRERQAAVYAAHVGASVGVVGPRRPPDYWPKDSVTLHVPDDGLHPRSVSLVSMVALQLLAEELSLRWDVNPDVPKGIDPDYRSALLRQGG
jgi:glucosamine--fructose-6-phosphate aminotransferase (isomerizing)